MWGKDDAAIAAYINGLQLHVLIDLIGRIPHNHHAVLGYRPAPVQIVAIYAATTASPFIDYFITDSVASPPELSHLFTESLILMPISHFVNNQRSLAPVPTNNRHAAAAFGAGGTAAAFNSFYKMDPARARSWWRVLNAVPNSSIMFVKYLYWQTARSTIMSHAEQHNISRARVHFVDKVPSFLLHLQVATLIPHLRKPKVFSVVCRSQPPNLPPQRVRECAVFLDCDKCARRLDSRMRPALALTPRRYNAMTGGLDVLYSGVPAVTLPGEDFSSRVLTSMLVYHGAAATVARSATDYERLAEALLCADLHARHEAHGEGSRKPSCRSSPRQADAIQRLLLHLDSHRHTGTLFNTQAWVTCAEAALRMAVDLRAFAPKRLHHAVVARHVCAPSL